VPQPSNWTAVRIEEQLIVVDSSASHENLPQRQLVLQDRYGTRAELNVSAVS
jgi:hypothetical protein